MANEGTRIQYVVGRSKHTGRPMCQHVVDQDISMDLALCGYDLLGTSREYMTKPLLTILCKRCERRIQ